MKPYKRLVLLVAAFIGILGLLFMASFGMYNACEFANTHTLFIKEQTSLALEANSLELSKEHARKALKELEIAKTNLADCGCEPALSSVEGVEENLKKAAVANSKKNTQTFLKLALQNTQITLKALKEFNVGSESNYGDDLLVMNTKNVLNEQGGVLLTPAKQMQLAMDKSLSEFEISLGNVVAHVECTDAFSFINKILSKSNRHLQEKTLTAGQREYHTRVKSIARNALLKLDGCPAK